MSNYRDFALLTKQISRSNYRCPRANGGNYEESGARDIE